MAKGRCYLRVQRDGKLVAQVLKLKGIHKTHRVQKLITGPIMRKLVTAYAEEKQVPAPIFVPQFQISKNFHRSLVWSTDMIKRIAFQSTKRWIPSNPDPYLTSLPFGFCKLPPDAVSPFQ